MIVDSIPVGPFQCNCYLIGDEKAGTGIVIDPGDEGEAVLEMVSKHALTITDIIITHAHLDHVSGVDVVRKATNAVVHMSRNDMPLFEIIPSQGALFGLRVKRPGDPEKFVTQNQLIRAGSMALRVIETPGHTPGSVSLLVEGEKGLLFTGDTLFAGSIGRTDLWGGSYEQIIESIVTRLLPLGTDVLVYPGHGESTSLGEEREYNPFLAASR